MPAPSQGLLSFPGSACEQVHKWLEGSQGSWPKVAQEIFHTSEHPAHYINWRQLARRCQFLLGDGLGFGQWVVIHCIGYHLLILGCIPVSLLLPLSEPLLLLLHFLILIFILILIFCFVSLIVCISIHEFNFFPPDSTYHWGGGAGGGRSEQLHKIYFTAGVKPPHHQKKQLPICLEKALPSGKPPTCPRRPKNSWPDTCTCSLMGLRRATPLALPLIPILFVCDRWSAPGRQDTRQWGKLPTEID